MVNKIVPPLFAAVFSRNYYIVHFLLLDNRITVRYTAYCSTLRYSTGMKLPVPVIII